MGVAGRKGREKCFLNIFFAKRQQKIIGLVARPATTQQPLPYVFSPPQDFSAATSLAEPKSGHEAVEEDDDGGGKNFNFVFSPPAKTPVSRRLKQDLQSNFHGWIKAQQDRESDLSARLDTAAEAVNFTFTPGLATNSILFLFWGKKSLICLEGLFELAWRPSRALNTPCTLLPELQRNKDTFKCGALGPSTVCFLDGWPQAKCRVNCF